MATPYDAPIPGTSGYAALNAKKTTTAAAINRVLIYGIS